MFTERIFSNEVIELGIAMNSVETADVIRRNNVSSPAAAPLRDNISPTDFMVKFNRLKIAMRQRSSVIL